MMARQTKSRSAERLVDILMELHLHGIVTRNSLMQKYAITERTVYRDLNALSPIIEHCGGGEYKLITPVQAETGNGLPQSLATFLKADSYFPERGKDFWQNLDERLKDNYISIHPLKPEHTVKSDLRRHLLSIEKAIKQRSVCRLVYNGKERELHPYKIINQQNIWYLLATENGKSKSFSISQIAWFDIKKETFNVDDKVLSLLGGSPTPWVSDSDFMVKLRVSGRHSRYFKRRDLLPEQQILHENSDGMTLSCRAAHEKQIIPLILFWLPDVEIIEPLWLKDSLHTMLRGYLSEQENQKFPTDTK